MKKIIYLFLAAFLVFALVGCGQKTPEGTVEELMTKVYSNLPEEERPMALTNIPVNDENIEMYLGTKDIEYDSILASESMITSVAHSVVLVKTKDNADVKSIMKKIEENVNPRKWICVGVEKEDVIIENKGNLIIVIIVEDKDVRDKIKSGWDNL